MLKRLCVVVAVSAAAALLVSSGSVGAAGDGTSVECSPSGASCTVSATSGGGPGASSSGPVHPVSGTGSSGACEGRNNLGQLVPCQDPNYGWLGSDGCYYLADPGFTPPPGDTADVAPPGQAGGYYVVTCALNGPGTGGGVVWLPAGAVAGPALPSPAQLADQAVRTLDLPDLAVASSPDANRDQLVGLPTWLWIPAAGWHPLSATASVPGESVTATATPVSVTWAFGDGTSTRCDGPGTPYVTSDSPLTPSPTCGHTYARSSAGQPNNAYPVTATVHWSVTWAGGGQNGAEPDLATTTSTALRVADVQALNTDSGLGG